MACFRQLSIATVSVLVHAAIILPILSSASGGKATLHANRQDVATVFLIDADIAEPPHAGGARPSVFSVTAASHEPTTVSVPAPPPPAVGPTPAFTEPTYYFPTSQLDRPPLPASEPELQATASTSTTHRPIWLHIFINRFGNVDRIDIGFDDLLDEEFAESIAAGFRATRFLPGRLDGRDVAASLKIEIQPP